MKILNVFFLLFVYSLCVACAVNRQNLNDAQSDLRSFTSDGSFVLSDPPNDRARIYFFRDNSKVGAYLGFTIRIIYEPNLNSKGEPNYDDYVDSLGYLATGRTFFADIYAGHKVAIVAKTEFMSYIIFTPKKGKIYCIKGDMKNGIGIPRPNINFVSKNVCEDSWIDYFKVENLDFQNQWRKVYNERGDKILSESPFKDEEKKEVKQTTESKKIKTDSKKPTKTKVSKKP
ncbi:hypothetical protein [Helicobacter saguini]|uniref:hypothetical protein n=1 Tax=Helicobacter saguini TaxID=1548018 RepID=UPI00192931C8|nr:hypothetical protein [Helicobacter saguini]